MRALGAGEHPVVEVPTGGGKSLIGAEIAHRLYAQGKRVLVCTHVQELVEANAAEFEELTGMAPGVLCAGLERFDKHQDVLFASVQSLYSPVRKGEIEPFDVIIIDEADLVADKNSDAKFYPTLFRAFKAAQRVGMTATPYRMDGLIYGEGKYFTQLVYRVDVLELVEQGYLSPLVGVNTNLRVNRAELSKMAGEFVMSEVALREDEDWLRKVIASVQRLAANRQHVAVFCPSVDVAELSARMFTLAGWPADFIVSETEERSEKLARWKRGELRVMCSVNTLYRGFNFPALDCIVGLRPTESVSLHVQMLGRGTRKAEGKKNCLVLDYAGNILAHGGIAAGMQDAYDESPVAGGAPVKVKAEARPELVAPLKRANHVTELTDADPMFAGAAGADCKVLDVSYICIPSSKIRGQRMLMVSYDCERKGVRFNAKQFVLVEHNGFALQQAAHWFARRGRGDFPRNADKALRLCYGLPVPRRVRVRKVGKWLNVVKEEF